MKKTKYRSGAEASLAKYLKNKRVKFKYEPYPMEYVVVETRKYWPDFELTSLNSKDDNFLIEFKGRFTAADRKKMLLIQKQYIFADIRLVFQQDNRLSKTSKTRYSDWAKKNGFKYHVGISLPKEWIEELK